MTLSYLRIAVAILAVVVIGILAGLYVGTGLAQHSNLGVAYEIWVPRQQAEVGLFKDFMPQLGYAAVLLPAAAAILASGGRRWFFAAAAVLILGTIISTMFGEIPLNRMIGAWDPDSPVSGWETMRSAWMRAHWFKTNLSVIALIIAATGLSWPWRSRGA